METINLNCKFCESEVSVCSKWAKENGAAFCPTCCKAFPVTSKDFEVFDKLKRFKDSLKQFELEDAALEGPTKEVSEEKEIPVKTELPEDTSDDDGYYLFKLTEL